MPGNFIHKLRADLANGIIAFEQNVKNDAIYGKLKERLLKNNYKESDIEETLRCWRVLLADLDNPVTKRILFDSRQAVLFDELSNEIPQQLQGKLHFPFDQFYLEFTEPIEVYGQEPGHIDILRAILVRNDNLQLQTGDNTWSLVVVTFFFSGDDGGLVDRTFHYHIDSCWPFAQVGTMRRFGSIFPEEAKDESVALACFESGGRVYGWFEKAIASHSVLLSWILAYMMAKSITIVQETISRQERRWYERHNQIPKPWHLVKLDPKIVGKIERGESDIHQSYRYDVIGHLRFGKHKTREGYRDTIEWVSPHQRGLANSLYIPKTYDVKSGRKIAQESKKYFQDVKVL